MNWGTEGEVVNEFGRGGLGGLHAIATGCLLLATIGLYVTLDGVHYLGTTSAPTVTTWTSVWC